jgi:hypothetical protein
MASSLRRNPFIGIPMGNFSDHKKKSCFEIVSSKALSLLEFLQRNERSSVGGEVK